MDKDISDSWLSGSVEPELWLPVQLARETLTGWAEEQARKVYAEIIKTIHLWVLDVGRPENEAARSSNRTTSRAAQKTNRIHNAARRGLTLGYGVGLREEEPWHYGGPSVSNNVDLLVYRLWHGKYKPFLELVEVHGIDKLLAVLVLGQAAKAVTPAAKFINHRIHELAAYTACLWLTLVRADKNARDEYVPIIAKIAAKNAKRKGQIRTAINHSAKNRSANRATWVELARNEAENIWPNNHRNNRMQIARKVKKQLGLNQIGAGTIDKELKGVKAKLKKLGRL